MQKIRPYLSRQGDRFWWAIRLVLVASIALAIFLLGWLGGEDYVTNIYTELIGVAISIGFTVVFVDRYYANREEKRQTEELKRRLFREAGGRSNERAIAAIDELQDKGWLEGDESLLKEVYLNKAELQKADLSYCNLVRTVFYMADLQDANLAGSILYEASFNEANLRRAQLLGADLRNARLSGAGLHDAELYQTNLTGAVMIGTFFHRAFLDSTYLNGADLRHADFSDANLNHADLRGANALDANFTNANLMAARLPDGSLGGATNMERFTNRYHSEFEPTLQKINEIRKEMDLDPIPLP